MTKAVIFDFDGTIADSFEVFVEVLVAAIGRKEGFSPEEIVDLRGSSTREIMRKLGIKKWQLPILAVKGKRALGAKMERVEPFQGIPEAFKELHKSGLKIYILSTNTSKNIKGFLKKYGLENDIDEIYADIGIFGKVKWLSKLMKQQGLQASECVYIGDETRDIEATKKVGMKCIAVSWGYGNPETLQAYHPDNLVGKPLDLPKSII
jgi:phosphoglycolate phosphatase